ncbi:6-phosphogluconolactonase [Rhodobacteraceae bacterium KMM 6894]|nr:6-phosphogluconolactonase [Rhodobacteraceae bacterium KMM 6894]
MNLIEYPDAELMAMSLATTLSGALNAALRNNDRVLFVVPGGTTPGPVFDVLCGANVDWGRVDILLSDERWRPEEHIRSNTRLVRQRLLIERAAAAKFIPLYRRDMTVDEAAPQVSETITPHLPVAVALLGMGADMHTASLFPGNAALEFARSDTAPALIPVHIDGEPEPRVSLSLPVLRGAMSIHIVITGDAKRAALAGARGLDTSMAPVGAVLEDATVHWAP